MPLPSLESLNIAAPPDLTVTMPGGVELTLPLPPPTRAQVEATALEAGFDFSPSITSRIESQEVETGKISQAPVLTPVRQPTIGEIVEVLKATKKPKTRAPAAKDGRVNTWQANQNPEAVRYFTPPWLLDMILAFFEPFTGSSVLFDTDPAFDPEAFVRATHAYDIRAGQDGLSLPWWGSTFVNPPYDKPAPWLKKAATRYVTRRTPWEGYGIKWYGSDQIMMNAERTASIEVCKPEELSSASPAMTRSPPPNEPTGWVDPIDGRAQTIMLVNVAPGTKAWQDYVFGCPDCLCLFFNKRITFYKRGVGYEGPNNRDSALLYYGPNHTAFADNFRGLGTLVKSWNGEVRQRYDHGHHVPVSNSLPMLTLETAKGHFGWLE